MFIVVRENLMTKAVAYMRTSSGVVENGDNDSDKRQQRAIQAYAEKHNIEILDWYYDANVKGSEPVHLRPGFAAMMSRIAGNGVRTILIETANRFARELMVQETGYAYLKDLGITLVPVDAPDHFTSDDPMATAIRQIIGVIVQLDKAMTVAKLRGARERIRREQGRCEGRKPAPEAARALARELHTQGMPLRKIASTLAQNGFLSPSGKVYGAQSVKAMLRD